MLGELCKEAGTSYHNEGSHEGSHEGYCIDNVLIEVKETEGLLVDCDDGLTEEENHANVDKRGVRKTTAEKADSANKTGTITKKHALKKSIPTEAH